MEQQTEQTVVQVKTADLTEHPLNSDIYNKPSEDELADLCRSIEEQGILEPLLAKPDNTLLSGHRRHMAATLLGLTTVPVIYMEPESEETTLIEANRYRRKTVSEIMREAEKLIAVESAMAARRSALKIPGTRLPTREKVARALGIGSGYQLDKLKRVWDEAKHNPNIAEALKKIDSGQTSVNAVFKSLTPPKTRGEEGFDLQLYSIWYFGAPDPYLGMPHPGRIAGQVVQNCVHYYTQEGDLVVDPFAGGGITVDACVGMDREYICLDIAPVRDEVQEWDITKGYPDNVPRDGAQLVFADPPYWNMLQADYEKLHEDTVASFDLTDFTEMLHKLARDTYDVVRSGGYFCCIMMPQAYRLPEGIPFIDWPFEVRIAMDAAGFTPYRRITNRWPTSIWNAAQVNQAKDQRNLLQVTGDVIVGLKA